MDMKQRIKTGVLWMIISFRRATAGMDFQTERDLSNYVCKDFWDGIKFSQSSLPASPYVRKVVKVKRDNSWNKPSRIAKLVAMLHTLLSSILHYGFLQEHGEFLFRIIPANLSVKRTKVYSYHL